MSAHLKVLLFGILSLISGCDREVAVKQEYGCALFSLESDREFEVADEYGIDTVRAGLQSASVSVSVEYGLDSLPESIGAAEEALRKLVVAWNDSSSLPKYESPDGGVVLQSVNSEDIRGLKEYKFFGFGPLWALHVSHDGSASNSEIASLVQSIHLFDPRNPPVPLRDPFSSER